MRLFERFNDLSGKCVQSGTRITNESSYEGYIRDEGLKVLLINPPIRLWSYPNIIPIGEAYVASSVILDGHKVFTLDLNADRIGPVKDDFKYQINIANKIRWSINHFKPDVVGIGGIITQYKTIKQIAQICKITDPNIRIVLGGGIASCLPVFMMQRLNIDVAIIEEGEITFSELLYRYEKNMSLDEVKGLLYRDSSGQIKHNGNRASLSAGDGGLDHISWPARELWPIDEIYKGNPIGHLNWESKWEQGKNTTGKFCVSALGTRGCPYKCEYCYSNYLGEKYRCRSVIDLVDELEHLKNRYNVSYVHFLDDLFLTNYKWALSFFQELKKRDLGLEWGATCRTNLIADDVERAKKQNRKHMLEQAYEVGMRQVGVGIESASPTILKNIDKSGQTPEKIAVAVKETKKVFGYIDPSFMIGSPGETEETIKETVDFCLKNDVDVETIFYTTAYPATPFWKLALQKGLIGKAVTGKKCEATDDMIEQYFEMLGENSETVRTNFSDELSDEKLIELGCWATETLKSKNRRHPGMKRHPHTGELEKIDE